MVLARKGEKAEALKELDLALKITPKRTKKKRSKNDQEAVVSNAARKSRVRRINPKQIGWRRV